MGINFRHLSLGRRHLLWALLAAVLVAGAVFLVVAAPWKSTPPRPVASEPEAGVAGTETLVLYDQSAYPEQAEVYAAQTANLASHFGSWTAEPVAEYQSGDMARYDAVVYIGSAYDEPLPKAFLDDVLAGDKPVMWIGENLWRLADHAPGFEESYGFGWGGHDESEIDEVRYKGTSLTRAGSNESGIAKLSIKDEEKVDTVATAVRADGSTLPWAVKSGNLTYIGEIPYTYTSPDDRYLAFTDMFYDLLAPNTPERHRALVRLEDVGPTANPDELRQIADVLHAEQVPFSIALYPVYRDPKGVYNNGVPQQVRLRDRPEVVEAVKYMLERGGTIILHGYTHQYDNVDNPYDGVSGNDFEFYRAHVDENNWVKLDGPVAEDSPHRTRERLREAHEELAAVDLPQPDIFEFPHYAASASDYKVIADEYEARYDQALYFPGVLTGDKPDYKHNAGQFFPYPVRDVYGSVVIPENMGQVTLTGYNQHPPRLPADVVKTAERNLVVRDGVASFFYNPYLGAEHLGPAIRGIKNLGYDFVPAKSVAKEW